MHRVLVIDDNKEIHADFGKVLMPVMPSLEVAAFEADLFGDTPAPAENRGAFVIDDAYQGEEALEKVRDALARGAPYAVAFVDVRMPPGWDGIETAKHLWRHDPNLQIVICTAYSDHDWDDIVRELGAQDRLLILKKPFDNIEVLQLAHALSQKWLLAREVETRLSDLESLVAARTAALEQKQEELVRAEKLSFAGKLAEGLAHEINNPLAPLRTNIEIVADGAATLHGVWLAVQALDDSAPLKLSIIGDSQRARETDELVSELPPVVNEMR